MFRPVLHNEFYSVRIKKDFSFRVAIFHSLKQFFPPSLVINPFHQSGSGNSRFWKPLIYSPWDCSSGNLTVKRKTEFSLETQPPGIYMVSVMIDGKMEMVKVIKY